jgi:hypothetical protein
MKFYIAHVTDDPTSGVIFWGASRDEALSFLADEDIDVDESSVKPVKDAGAVLFRKRLGRFPGDVEDLRFDGDVPNWSDDDDEEEDAQAVEGVA